MLQQSRKKPQRRAGEVFHGQFWQFNSIRIWKEGRVKLKYLEIQLTQQTVYCWFLLVFVQLFVGLVWLGLYTHNKPTWPSSFVHVSMFVSTPLTWQDTDCSEYTLTFARMLSPSHWEVLASHQEALMSSVTQIVHTSDTLYRSQSL